MEKINIVVPDIPSMVISLPSDDAASKARESAAEAAASAEQAATSANSASRSADSAQAARSASETAATNAEKAQTAAEQAKIDVEAALSGYAAKSELELEAQAREAADAELLEQLKDAVHYRGFIHSTEDFNSISAPQIGDIYTVQADIITYTFDVDSVFQIPKSDCAIYPTSSESGGSAYILEIPMASQEGLPIGNVRFYWNGNETCKLPSGRSYTATRIDSLHILLTAGDEVFSLADSWDTIWDTIAVVSNERSVTLYHSGDKIIWNGSYWESLTNNNTVDEAPEQTFKAMYDFEKIESIAKGIYNADNGWVAVRDESSYDGSAWHYVYGDIYWDPDNWGNGNYGISASKAIVRAETATENSYVESGFDEMPYRGLQGDSGFEDVTMHISDDNWHWYGLYEDNGDYGKNMVMYPMESGGVYSNINFYTTPVTEGRVAYGFKFKPLNCQEQDASPTTNIGGFGEIADSFTGGRYYGKTHSMTDKIVRARLDGDYGYAVYDETTAQWTTIATWAELYNKWHDLKYTLDFDEKTYTVYLDGAEKGTFPFSNQGIITAIDGIQFNNMADGDGAYHASMYAIDNVYATNEKV